MRMPSRRSAPWESHLGITQAGERGTPPRTNERDRGPRFPPPRGRSARRCPRDDRARCRASSNRTAPKPSWVPFSSEAASALSEAIDFRTQKWPFSPLEGDGSVVWLQRDRRNQASLAVLLEGEVLPSLLKSALWLGEARREPRPPGIEALCVSSASKSRGIQGQGSSRTSTLRISTLLPGSCCWKAKWPSRAKLV